MGGFAGAISAIGQEVQADLDRKWKGHAQMAEGFAEQLAGYDPMLAMAFLQYEGDRITSRKGRPGTFDLEKVFQLRSELADQFISAQQRSQALAGMGRQGGTAGPPTATEQNQSQVQQRASAPAMLRGVPMTLPQPQQPQPTQQAAPQAMVRGVPMTLPPPAAAPGAAAAPMAAGPPASGKLTPRQALSQVPSAQELQQGVYGSSLGIQPGEFSYNPLAKTAPGHIANLHTQLALKAMGEAAKPQYVIPLEGPNKGRPTPVAYAHPGIRYSPPMPLEAAKVWSEDITKGFTEQQMATAAFASAQGADPDQAAQVAQLIQSNPSMTAAAVKWWKEINSEPGRKRQMVASWFASANQMDAGAVLADPKTLAEAELAWDREQWRNRVNIYSEEDLNALFSQAASRPEMVDQIKDPFAQAQILIRFAQSGLMPLEEKSRIKLAEFSTAQSQLRILRDAFERWENAKLTWGEKEETAIAFSNFLALASNLATTMGRGVFGERGTLTDKDRDVVEMMTSGGYLNAGIAKLSPGVAKAKFNTLEGIIERGEMNFINGITGASVLRRNPDGSISKVKLSTSGLVMGATPVQDEKRGGTEAAPEPQSERERLIEQYMSKNPGVPRSVIEAAVDKELKRRGGK